VQTDRCGVYCIEQTGTGLVYIGSSCRVSARWYAHRVSLNKGTHHAPRLQAAWTKYGADAFAFAVLEECSRTALLEREQAYLDAFVPAFNTCTLARSRAGVPHPPAVRERIRQAHLARPPKTPEHRAALSASLRQSVALKAAAASRVGVKRPPEVGEKVRAAKLGKPRPPEVVAKVRAANLGQKRTPEQRAALSALRKGRPFGPAFREKMRVVALQREARKREQLV